VSTVVAGWPVAFRGLGRQDDLVEPGQRLKGALLLFDHQETAMTRP